MIGPTITGMWVLMPNYTRIVYGVSTLEEALEADRNRALPKTPGAGKVEAAGIEPARHSLPNPAISSDFAQEAT